MINHPEGYVNHFDIAKTKQIRVGETIFWSLPPGSWKAKSYDCKCTAEQENETCPVHYREVMVNE